MKKVVFVFAFLILAPFSYAINVNVNLFTGYNINQALVKHNSGRYVLKSGNNELTSVSHNESLLFVIKDSIIEVFEDDNLLTSGSSFILFGIGINNSLSIEANDFPVRYYDDDLLISIYNNNLTIINNVDLEKYIGGVIQAESGGCTDLTEFFMVQALVSRTYAMRLLTINGSDFILSDDVSNQVYKGRPVKPEIFKAVEKTQGQVILFDNDQLINAVFHSNSGGYTMASNDVWVSALPYLKPVIDSFAVDQRNYLWRYDMRVIDWLNYLDKTHNYPVHNDSMKIKALNFTQNKRGTVFHNNIPLTTIRRELGLKSTFFNIHQEHDKVIFTGRGFGHGVGLSQEGAIKMAELGYQANCIIQFYFNNVFIKPLSEIYQIAALYNLNEIPQ